MTAASELVGVCQSCDGTFGLTGAGKIPVHPWPNNPDRCHGSRRVPLRLAPPWVVVKPVLSVVPDLPESPPADVSHVPAPDLVPPLRTPVPKFVCGAGPGPCGAPNARLFMCGWRCDACAPKGFLTPAPERTAS
jgi:hypothetical protein